MKWYVKHLLLTKTDVLKTSIFSERKFEKNGLTLKSKNVQGISGGTFVLALLSATVFSLQGHVSDFF